MREKLLSLIGVLRLTRVSTAFAAISNVWFVILWTRWVPEHEPGMASTRGKADWLLLLGGAVTAVGLYAFGTCMNDVLDATRDRAWRRDRPLATGWVAPDAAVVTIACTLLLAVLGAATFGTPSVVLTGLIALAILLFNLVGKFVPGIGMLLLALVYAAHMLVPNLTLRFVWPVWFVMTHAMIVAGLTHLVGRKPPPMTPRAVLFAVAGWAGASAAVLGVGYHRSADGVDVERTLWPDWVPVAAITYPAALAVLFAVFAYRRIRRVGMGPRAAEKLGRYGALWLALYAAAWFWGVGAWQPAIMMSALAAGGFLGMVVLRELYGLVEHPLGYRR